VLREAAATAASLIFPFAPHCGAEVYELLTGDRVWEQPWPDADPAYLERDTVQLVAQVNGKLRDRFEVPAGRSRDELQTLAADRPKVQAHIDGKQVVKVVVVPDKLVNFVVR
jgi:leucyl-tRNA synthetase